MKGEWGVVSGQRRVGLAVEYWSLLIDLGEIK